MPSINSIISTALRKLGALSAGETAPTEEAAEALAELRRMLDAWSLENLICPYGITETFPLTPGQSFYSMGPAGDWVSVRPETIDVIRVRDGGSTYPLVRSTREVQQHQASVEAGRPTRWLFSADALAAYVELDAAPEGGDVLVTSTKPFDVTALDNFDRTEGGAPETLHPSGFTLTGIQTEITFPTGFEAAIVANLAVALQPEYPGAVLNDVVVAQAAGIKALIKRRNVEPLLPVPDPALCPRPRFDIMRGPF